MADKQEGGGECAAETSSLRAEIISLVATRLKEVSKKSKEGEISKVLARRKRKWRKRYKSSAPDSIDSALREEKETLFDMRIELIDTLVKRRRMCLGCARQMQREGDTSTLQVISGRLEDTRQSLQDYRESHMAASTLLVAPPTGSTAAEERILQGLESTLSQTTALAEIQKMKHHMTPRVPPIHRRPLTTNPLNDTHSTSLLVDHLQISSVRSYAIADKEETVVMETNGKREVSLEYRGSNDNGGHGAQTDGELHARETVEGRNIPDICTVGEDDRRHQNPAYSEGTELLEDDQIPVAQTVESSMVELTPEDWLHHSSRGTVAKSPQKNVESELKSVERDEEASLQEEEQEVVANSTAQSESDTEQDQEYEHLFKKIVETTKAAPESLAPRGRGRKRRSKLRKK